MGPCHGEMQRVKVLHSKIHPWPAWMPGGQVTRITHQDGAPDNLTTKEPRD